jgi:hypothetical protein
LVVGGEGPYGHQMSVTYGSQGREPVVTSDSFVN